MIVYVASKFENKDEVRSAMARLRREGHQIAYDWTTHPGTSDPAILIDEARNDFRAVLAADAVVLLFRPGMQGAWFEAGAAAAAGIPVVIVSAESTGNVFEYLLDVHRVPSLDAAMAILRCLPG